MFQTELIEIKLKLSALYTDDHTADQSGMIDDADFEFYFFFYVVIT